MERPLIYRYAIGLVVIALAIFLLLSIASHDPHDPPARFADMPFNQQPTNLCGIVGAYCAFGVRWLLGTGGYLFAIGLGILGAVLLAGKAVEDPVVRTIGSLIMLLAWCGGAALILPHGGTPAGNGGMSGFFLCTYLLKPIGAGAYVMVVIGFGLGALLAADAWVLWMGRKSVELLTIHGEEPAAKEEEPKPREKAAPRDSLAEQKELLRKRIEERRARAETPEPSARAEHREPVAGKTPTQRASAASEAPTVLVSDLRGRTRGQSGREVGMAAGESYRLPGIDLLDPAPPLDRREREEDLQARQEVLERTLEEFGIAAQVVEIDRGPVITQFELELAPGVKIGKIVGLSDDIARAMKAQSVRIVAPIPGKSTVGVEVPNLHRQTVRLREIFETGVLERRRMTIPLLLGKDAAGEPLLSDLALMPHLLIAGATGSGKSVCINSVIVTLLMTQHPDDLKMLLIDPKMVELAAFREIPHLMAPVMTDMKKAAAVLEWATHKMDERYSLLANVGVRNIAAYNALGEKGIRKRLGVGPSEEIDEVPFHIPHIVIIVDELADLMMIAAKDVENSITRLAQKSRAVGIHLIVATQRPSVDVVTGLIKANLPSRIAFQSSSKVDSRTILDCNGAEKLLGRGDMLFMPPGLSKLIRAQGVFTSDAEIRRVTRFLSDSSRPKFSTELVNPKGFSDGPAPAERDELFNDAVRIVLESQRGSVSLLQRKLGIGYSRAARLIDLMAETGLVGDYKGSQAREVLYTLEEWEEQQ